MAQSVSSVHDVLQADAAHAYALHAFVSIAGQYPASVVHDAAPVSVPFEQFAARHDVPEPG